MKSSFARLAALWALGAGLSILPAAELGQPAAPLEIAEWVKGEPVDLAALKGRKIVVVEFWATWCGPCRVSIPHLTEMQKKFQDRGVIFVGVSDEPAATVQPFVDKMGEKMDYTVAVDSNRKTSAGYMGAYGVKGIPHAFVVDKEGRVAWHGHPMSGLEKVLDSMTRQTFDLSAEKKRDAAQRKLMEYFELAAGGGSDEQLDKLGQQLIALDKEIGGLHPGAKLDLTEMRKLARFQAVMREYQRALLSGSPEAALEELEVRAKPLAPPGFDFARFKGQYQLQRLFLDYYRAVTSQAGEARVTELETKLAAIQSNDAEMLNEMAWTLLTDERIKNRNRKLALKFARAAYDASQGSDPGILDTYARALFDNGQVAEAILQQQRALELNQDQDRKPELEAALKRYRAGGASQ